MKANHHPQEHFDVSLSEKVNGKKKKKKVSKKTDKWIRNNAANILQLTVTFVCFAVWLLICSSSVMSLSSVT